MRYLLSLLLVLIFQGCNKPDDSSLASENTAEDFYIETCSTFAEISFSSYIIQNNNWGEDNFPGEQCIFLSGPDTLFGWSWNYPANDSEYKYPEIIAGRKPWGTDSNFPLLPIRISNIKNFSTSYDVTTESAGKNNLAYDIWVNGVDNSQMISGDNIRAEIMIWVDDNELCCWGDKQGTVMISNSEFDVYINKNDYLNGKKLADSHQVSCTYVDYVAILKKRKKFWDSLKKMKKRLENLPKNSFRDKFINFLDKDGSRYYKKIFNL